MDSNNALRVYKVKVSIHVQYSSFEDTKVVPINFKTDMRANVQHESGL